MSTEVPIKDDNTKDDKSSPPPSCPTSYICGADLDLEDLQVISWSIK